MTNGSINSQNNLFILNLKMLMTDKHLNCGQMNKEHVILLISRALVKIS